MKENGFIDRLETFRQNNFFQLFTVYTRFLIGSAFVIASINMGKLKGISFPIDSAKDAPIHSAERFFETISNSGIYWQFIGWAQIISGLLLITQKFGRKKL